VVGCAELGFSVDRDRRIPAESLLFDLSVRNRCVRTVPLDLTALRIVGHDESGATIAFSMFDPRHEIRTTAIDAEAAAVERIRLDPPDALSPASRIVCIDVTHVSRDAERTAPAPVCIDLRPSDRGNDAEAGGS
jgi:hypothetical protein